MNLNDMISQIQARLGFREDLQEEILKEINLAQHQLERDVSFNPYFLWRGQDIYMSESCINYALPETFIRVCEFNNPLFHPAGAPFAYEVNRGMAVTSYAKDNSVGEVVCYTIQHGNLRLNKRVAGIFRLFFISSTAPLGGLVTENLWTEKAYDLLMNKAGLACAKLTRDNFAVDSFEKDLAASLVNFKRECIAFEDFGFAVARADRLYSEFSFPVGGWYDAELCV